jgi:hypothetical protein
MITKVKNENLKLGRIGTCPVCNGTTRRPINEDEHYLRNLSSKEASWYGYDKETDTRKCGNCGPRGMFAGPSDGKVHLKPDGLPCKHRYHEETIGRCYHQSTCEHCGDSYTIDSGD